MNASVQSVRQREDFPRQWAGGYALIRSMALNVLFPLLFLMLSGGQFVFAKIISTSGENLNCTSIDDTKTTCKGGACMTTGGVTTSCVSKNTTPSSSPNLSGLMVSCPTTITCENGKCTVIGASCNTTLVSSVNQVVINGNTFIFGIVNDGGTCTIINNEAYGCTSSNKVAMPPANCYVYPQYIYVNGKSYGFNNISCVPVAAFVMSSVEDNGALVVNVDASPSNDNGTIVSYEWTTSTGQSATGETASLVFNQPGTHTITLKITDDEGKTAILQDTLVVNLNPPPQVSFTTSVTEGNIPLTVALDASASTDDGSITSYAWSTSAGQTASGQTAAVTFNDVGTHTVKLTVTDNLGKTASLEKTVVATKQLIRLIAANYPTDIKVGQSFDLTLQFVPDAAQPADGIQVYLEFDPTKLKVNQVTNSGVLDYELFNEIGANSINFAAGSFANPAPLTPFDLVTINFTALQATGDIGTLLHFDPNQSNVTHLGEYLPQQYEDIRLIVGETVALPKCEINLQGRPAAPDVSWETELRLYFEGALYLVNTDSFGHCELPNAISLGDHSLCVKNSHTLANRVGPPLVLNSDGLLDFGTLVEGDVNDDNKINLLDMSELTKLTNGQKDYHKQADLNADGQISVADPNLLKSNFNKPKLGDTGFCQWDGITYRKGLRDSNGTVVLNTSPVPMNLPTGSTFNMDILVQTDSSQAIDATAVYLNFDPSKLQVNRLIHGSYLDFWLLSEFDNNQGQIGYAAGLWNNQPATGSFTLVTIEFTVLTIGGEQTLGFDTTAPRETDVVSAGKSVLGGINFELIEPKVTLTMAKVGEGTITAQGIDCGDDCTEEYILNTEVKLTATPTNGYQFADWSGDCTSDMVTMDKAKSCTAIFNAIPVSNYTAYSTLLGRTGKRLAGATIHLGDNMTLSGNIDHLGHKTTTTDANGDWSIGGLLPGKYGIIAMKGKSNCLFSEVEILDNGQYQQRVNYACDLVTYGDDNASYIAIWHYVNGNLEYVDTVSVEDFDAKFQEHRDYEIVDSQGEYLLEGLDEAGNTTSKIEVVRTVTR